MNAGGITNGTRVDGGVDGGEKRGGVCGVDDVAKRRMKD